jgi:hypothetical protein
VPLDLIRCASAKLERKGEVVELTPHACLQHALDREADCGMTAETLGAMFGTLQRRGRVNLSTTALIADCPREIVLERTEPVPAIDPRTLWWAFRGTLAHEVIARHRRPAPTWGERRVWMRHPFVEGAYLGCQPDIVDPDVGILWDYKSKNSLPKGHWRTPYPSDNAQLQVNRFIVDNADYVEPEDRQPGEYLGPLPGASTKDGTTYKPNPRWLAGDELNKLKPAHYGAQFEHLYIVYFDFENGSLILESKEYVEVPKVGGGTRKVLQPVIWDDADVLQALEANYWALKEGLEDPVNKLPPIPDHLVGWPMDTRSACSRCNVRLNCMRREGVPV